MFSCNAFAKNCFSLREGSASRGILDCEIRMLMNLNLRRLLTPIVELEEFLPIYWAVRTLYQVSATSGPRIF
jgi:hypothetical protein